MNVRMEPGFWQRVRQTVRRWSGKPAVEGALQCAAALGLGFFLAGLNVARTVLPLPLCLAAALGLGLPSFAAYAGGCLGYLLFWDSALALEPVAAGLLVEACLCLFDDRDRVLPVWFAAGTVVLLSAVVGLLFLLEQRFAPSQVWRLLLRLAVGGAGTWCFRMAIYGGDRMAKLAILACLCGGLCAIRPLGIPLGLLAVCILSAAALQAPMAVVMAGLGGLALDLCWEGNCATAVLVLAALVCPVENRLVQLGLWLGVVLLGVLVTGSSSLILAAAILMAPLSLVLPVQGLFGTLPAVRARQDQRLTVAAGLLDQMSRCLCATAAPDRDPEAAAVFDQAAERVCRMCSLWDHCWNDSAQETCAALDRAAPAMMTRGKVVREDLPALFVNRCRHLEGFLTAVNRELDDLSCRRQCRSRIRESREILARQYQVLSAALVAPVEESDEPCRFRTDIGFRSQGRREDSVSGDRGATFRLGKCFYLLLCDGMGTGPSASAEAGTAISILRTLLLAGTSPDRAMEVLNGIYILRDDGGFATVDLVQIDLTTGDAILLKWGAAPSYLKRKNEVEKIGTASLPPGLGVGDAHRPWETRLSLSRGEQLILVSDGAGGEDAERFLRQTGPLSPKDLASAVIGCTAGTDDDRTAAVITLRQTVPG